MFRGQLAWLADASALVFDAADQGGGGYRWNQASSVDVMSGGTVRRLTNENVELFGRCRNRSGRTMVASGTILSARLWVAPEVTARAPVRSRDRQRTRGAVGMDWTPDGRVVYSATTQGSSDIWIANSDGSQPRQLTSDPDN